MIKSLLSAQLDQAMRGRELAAVYTDAEVLKFTVGYVVSLCDRFVILESIDSAGNFEGYVGKFLDDVARVSIGSDYLKKMAFLSGSPNSLPFPGEIDSIETLLRYLTKYQVGVNIRDRSGYSELGLIVRYDDEFIQLRMKVGTNEDGGIVTLRIADIGGINFFEPKERLLDEWVLNRMT